MYILLFKHYDLFMSNHNAMFIKLYLRYVWRDLYSTFQPMMSFEIKSSVMSTKFIKKNTDKYYICVTPLKCVNLCFLMLGVSLVIVFRFFHTSFTIFLHVFHD